jgi:hypothetical protein
MRPTGNTNPTRATVARVTCSIRQHGARHADAQLDPKGIDMAKAKTYRPEDLASSLGISGKVLRAYLRKTFPRPASAKGSTWVVTAVQANACRKYFKGQRGVSPVTVAPKAKRVTRKASGVTVTVDKSKATVTPGTRAEVTKGLDAARGSEKN